MPCFGWSPTRCITVCLYSKSRDNTSLSTRPALTFGLLYKAKLICPAEEPARRLSILLFPDRTDIQEKIFWQTSNYLKQHFF